MFERSSWLALVVGAAVSVGCVDPKGAYDDFKERESKTLTDAGCNAGGTCTAPAVGSMDGQWLLAESVVLKPAAPILFFVDLTTSDNGGVTAMQWTLTPLDAKTRTPIPPPDGDPIVLTPSDIPADGKWTFDVPPLAITGKANTVTLGANIVADVVISGDVCEGRDFVCGDLSGEVTQPPLGDVLSGSTWTLTRLPAKDTLPDPIYIDCCKAEAGPPPT